MPVMTRLCGAVLNLYPKEFRSEFAVDIKASFDLHYRGERVGGASRSAILLDQLKDIVNLFGGAVYERASAAGNRRRITRRQNRFSGQDTVNERIQEDMEYRVVYKVYFAWQARDEAAWLQEMSRAGWDFVDYTWFIYYFRKKETPREYEYKFERSLALRWQLNEQERYFSRMAEDGWEFFKYFMGWYYFRRPVRNGAGETGTRTADNDAVAGKPKRGIFLGLGVALICLGAIWALLGQVLNHTSARPLLATIIDNFFLGVCIGLAGALFLVGLFSMLPAVFARRPRK